MRELFNVLSLMRPISPEDIQKNTTHCMELMKRVLEGAITEKLNYTADSLVAEVLHSDGKRYRIEIKPIREN